MVVLRIPNGRTMNIMIDQTSALLKYVKSTLKDIDKARLPDEYYYASLPYALLTLCSPSIIPDTEHDIRNASSKSALKAKAQESRLTTL
jgi:hypothetical protein